MAVRPKRVEKGLFSLRPDSYGWKRATLLISTKNTQQQAGVWEIIMIATMVMASAFVAAPTTLESVNFVHNYKQNEKASYDLHIESLAEEMEIFAEIEVAFKAKSKKGNTNASFTFKELDMGGQDVSSSVPVMEFELSKHGTPTAAVSDTDGETGIIAFVSLLTTYLPAATLKEGDSFKIKLPDAAFTYTGSGKFEGMKKVGDATVAVLSSKGTLDVSGQVIDLKVTTYYSVKDKMVVQSLSEIDVEDQSFDISLKRKKK